MAGRGWQGACSPKPRPLPPCPIPHFALIPIIEGLGFPSLLPVIYQVEDGQWCFVKGTISLHSDCTVNLNSHPLLILAFPCRDEYGNTCYITSLLHHEQIQTDIAVAAHHTRSPFPLTGTHIGGRDGVLIMDTNPLTQDTMKKLFMVSCMVNGAYGCTLGFIDQICHTPSELLSEFHFQALY